MFRTAYREIGLFGLVKRTVNEFLEDDMPTASALAYQMLFSLFPFLLVLITLVGYLHLPEFFAWLREQAALLLPPEAMDQVNPVIDQLQQQKGGLLSIGIAVALDLLGGHPLDDDRAQRRLRREGEPPGMEALLPCRSSTPSASPCCCWWRPA